MKNKIKKKNTYIRVAEEKKKKRNEEEEEKTPTYVTSVLKVAFIIDSCLRFRNQA
jgi:hypothetical protein